MFFVLCVISANVIYFVIFTFMLVYLYFIYSLMSDNRVGT